MKNLFIEQEIEKGELPKIIENYFGILANTESKIVGLALTLPFVFASTALLLNTGKISSLIVGFL